MPQPPPSPPSSDIKGVDRDEAGSAALGKKPLPDQQEKLAAAHDQDAARPPYDPKIAPQRNSR